MYGLSIGDKAGDLEWTVAYFSREQNFSTIHISHTFCQNTTKFGSIRGLAKLISRVSWTLDRGPMASSYMHQSFTDTLVKCLFDNFPMFADSFSVFLFTVLPED